jgi:hypothetical protein
VLATAEAECWQVCRVAVVLVTRLDRRLMTAALVIGREGSQGFPGKNTHPVVGRPLVAYPLMAARDAESVDQVYLSTDSQPLMEIGREHGASVIQRPAHLASAAALGEDAFVHGYEVIRNQLGRTGVRLEQVVLLFANAATVTAELIEDGIATLRAHPEFDSAFSVSRYNMWSPLRARRIAADGLLEPFVPFEVFGNPATLSCDRDSQGDVWFADMGLSVVRPHCLEHIADGLLPPKWMGRRIAPLKQTGGLDVDYEWQIPLVEHWLRSRGVEPPVRTAAGTKTAGSI